ncbi:MAG: TlpA family protein disulfide reductase [Treponema sp.]|nr:TlpA family protein disulfide reductase [Treponema sp.]MBD5447174.1 TlpA family protein disulfide reductase [Treponema sp.]
MKHIFLSIALLLAGAAVFAQSVSFSSADLDKNKITDEIFSAADVTVVNVWGTFCPPCIREMPELAEWQKSMPKNAQIIGIVCDVNSTDDAKGISNAKAILKKTGATFPNVIANQSLAQFLNGIQFVPTTFLVDKNGNIVGDMIVGAQVAKYKKAVEDYLAKK